jgi:hypothetical protein
MVGDMCEEKICKLFCPVHAEDGTGGGEEGLVRLVVRLRGGNVSRKVDTTIDGVAPCRLLPLQ